MPYGLLVGRDLDHLCVLLRGRSHQLSVLSAGLWCAAWFLHVLVTSDTWGAGELQSTLCLGRNAAPCSFPGVGVSDGVCWEGRMQG